MVTLHWHDSLCIGINKIDRNNKFLIRNLKSLLDAITSDPVSRATRDQFFEFLDYALFHFACEEIWMSHPRYIFIAEHHAAHAMLLDKFQELERVLIHDNNINGVSDILYPSKALLFHIKKVDKQYAHWLLKTLN
jgi:hemerythrin